MTKNDWIKDVLCDYMDIDVLDYLMKEELVDQIKKYFDERKIKIFDITEDINNINYIMVTKDDMPIAFKTFDSTGYKIDVVDINALINSNFQVEEKNNTIKQLTEKLQQFQSQYQDYKAACTKIIDDQRAENLELQDKNRILSQLKDVNVKSIQELCRKVLYRDKKIEELSTKLAKVVVERNGLSKQVDFWKDEYVAKCSEYRSLEGKKDELRGQIEDLESTIESQKEQIVDLENRINDILSIPAFKLSYDYKTSMGDVLQ